ncbi:CUB domain [Trinorchestia longiramus]|nr:CUB domain [Trinorchestia longiramus]
MKVVIWSSALLLAVLGHTSANPVTTKEAEYTAMLQSAHCGGHAEIVVGVGESVLLSTQYLLDSETALPHGCDITWRIAVQSLDCLSVGSKFLNLGSKFLIIVERPLLTLAIRTKRREHCQRFMNDLKSAPPGRVIMFSDEKTWIVDPVRNRRNDRYLSLDEASGLENYGLEVSGILELDDPANEGDDCTSSLLELTDQDDEGDTTAITQILCGNKRISYLTYQDSVTVHLQVSQSGVAGRGFSLRFTPIFACGGLLTGSPGDTVDIETPEFPEPYPRDLSCFWDIEAPIGSSVTVNCEKFSLLGRRKDVCRDYLMVQQDGDLKFFCGKELSGQKRSFTIAVNEAMLYFRSSGRSNPAPGFQCSITFQ